MPDEGYIKFSCNWIRGEDVSELDITEINAVRKELFQRGFIGRYPDGVGFGNISVRSTNKDGFIITGTQTQAIEFLLPSHYTHVTSYNISQNRITCRGLSQASSESLSHAAIYEGDASVHAVIHTHHSELWRRMKGKEPTTSPQAVYGTIEMGFEILRLMRSAIVQAKRIVIMGGHEDGIITFGETPRAAQDVLMKHLKRGRVDC